MSDFQCTLENGGDFMEDEDEADEDEDDRMGVQDDLQKSMRIHIIHVHLMQVMDGVQDFTVSVHSFGLGFLGASGCSGFVLLG